MESKLGCDDFRFWVIQSSRCANCGHDLALHVDSEFRKRSQRLMKMNEGALRRLAQS